MKKTDTVTVTINKNRKRTSVGSLLSDIIHGEKPCGGHGKCGKCKVIATGGLSSMTDAEKALLTEQEIADGVRLSCLTYVMGDCAVTYADKNENVRILTSGAVLGSAGKMLYSNYGVAVDIGTTTIAARIYDASGSLLASSSKLNPQSEWGADVISRIEASIDGKSGVLASSVREAVDMMISELSGDAGIMPEEIDGAVITGNTVMLCLLTGETLEPFSHAPFEAGRLFGEYVSPRSIGLTKLSDNAAVYLPPCISAFVGADLVCAVLAAGLCEGESSAMLADIGTNGEMALWHNGRLTVCSTAAGPAFEGVGIHMGMRGADGAVDRVFVRDGEICTHVIGNTQPIGICGSGLIDAVAVMLDTEVIDECGYLEDESFMLCADVCLIPKDIRMLQLAKSAICAGLMTLMKVVGIDSFDVTALYVAGGFGYYINIESASKIGLLPKRIAEKVQAIGNAALDGASLLLLDCDRIEKCAKIAKDAVLQDLASSAVFSDSYISGMLFKSVDD